MVVDYILLALTGLFALAPGLGIGVEGAIGAVDNAAAAAAEGATQATQIAGSRLATGLQTVENALFAYPQIGRFLFPIDTASSQIVQMAELKTQLVGLVQQVQTNLNMTIMSVESNVTEFLAFASQGNYTGDTPSLPAEETYLLYGFNTYIISAGLAGNNVKASLGKDTNVQALATNSSSNHGGIDLSACKSYNEVNVCDSWWYSEKYNSTFGLDDFSHMNRDYGDTLTQLFTNFTTGQLLFDAAYACNQEGNYGQPVNITVNAAGVNTGCLSQLEIATWDMTCVNPSKSSCEFIEMPRQNTFWASCNSHSIFSVTDSPLYCVPFTYLGPAINSDTTELIRT